MTEMWRSCLVAASHNSRCRLSFIAKPLIFPAPGRHRITQKIVPVIITCNFEIAILRLQPAIQLSSDNDALVAEVKAAWSLFSTIAGITLDPQRKVGHAGHPVTRTGRLEHPLPAHPADIGGTGPGYIQFALMCLVQDPTQMLG